MVYYDENPTVNLVKQVLENYQYNADQKYATLEKRVVAAEAVSQAATAQMTAVLAVLNVLAAYVGPPKEKP